MQRIAATFLFALCSTALCNAQAPQAAPTDSTFQKPSHIVSSALTVVAKAGSNVDLNKWKGSNSDKSNIDSNLAAIQKDLRTTLPPLLAAADAAPASPSASLPVLMNIDALYNVILRVTIASHSDAPHEQASELDQALNTLDNARRDLGDQVRGTMLAQDKTIRDLNAQITQLKAAATPPPPPPPPAKPVRRKKPAPKPTTAQ